MTVNSIVRASANQVSCDLSGEAAILNLQTGTYYGLDPVGATIWKFIEQPRTVGSVRDWLLERYEVDAERCERDLFELLGELSAEGLVEVDANLA